VNGASGFELAAWMDECLEAIVAERFEKKHLRLSAGIAGAEQTSTQHARGVHGDGVAWRDKLDDVGEPPVLDGTGPRSTTMSRLWSRLSAGTCAIRPAGRVKS
jgi:hypothetical protein